MKRKDNFATYLADKAIKKHFQSDSREFWKNAQKRMNQFINPTEFFSGGQFRKYPPQYHNSYLIGRAIFYSCAACFRDKEDHKSPSVSSTPKHKEVHFLGFSPKTISQEPTAFLIVWKQFQEFISEYILFSGVVSELAPVKITTMLTSYYTGDRFKSAAQIRSEKESYLAKIRRKYGSFKGEKFKSSRFEQMAELCLFIFPHYRRLLQIGFPFLWNAIPDKRKTKVRKNKVRKLCVQKMESFSNIPFFMGNTSRFLINPDSIPYISTGPNTNGLRNKISLWMDLIPDLNDQDLKNLSQVSPEAASDNNKNIKHGGKSERHGRSGKSKNTITERDLAVGKKKFFWEHREIRSRINQVRNEEKNTKKRCTQLTDEKVICPECNSSNVKLNERTGEYVCTSCGCVLEKKSYDDFRKYLCTQSGGGSSSSPFFRNKNKKHKKNNKKKKKTNESQQRLKKILDTYKQSKPNWVIFSEAKKIPMGGTTRRGI